MVYREDIARIELEEFDKRFLEARESGQVYVEFSLQEIQEAAKQRAHLEGITKEEDIQEGVNFCTESYMREIQKAEVTLAKYQNEEGGISPEIADDPNMSGDLYAYYYKRKAEVEGLSEQEISDIFRQKFVEFGSLVAQQREVKKQQEQEQDPFSSPFEPDDLSL